MENFDPALKAFNRALAVDPKFYLAYNNRGVTHKIMKRYDDAIRDFTKCIEIHASYAPAYANRAGIYFKQGKFEEARKDADKCIQLDPKNAVGYVNRGMAREMLRDLDGACQDWKKARELGSEKGKVYQSGNCSY